MPVEAQENRTRPRVGVSSVAGGFVGATQGVLGGLSPRVGIQIDDTTAVYLQSQWLVGEFLSEPGRGLAGALLHALMFDVTIAGRYQFGAGPSLDYVFGCDDAHQSACRGAGAYFGVDLRVAVLAGYTRSTGRAGPVFSFDIHPTWLGDDALVTMLLGIGYEVS